MKAEIVPTEKIEVLKENLEKRVESIEIDSGRLIAELESAKILERTPGIEKFRVKGEEKEGLKGKPIDEQAYARLESREDAAKALLATIMGYDLRILETDREWDYRNLKRYNPDIKHLKFSEPQEFLEIEKAIFRSEGLEEIEIEVSQEEVEEIYRKMLT